jgi:hypothetical protein
MNQAGENSSSALQTLDIAGFEHQKWRCLTGFTHQK